MLLLTKSAKQARHSPAQKAGTASRLTSAAPAHGGAHPVHLAAARVLGRGVGRLEDALREHMHARGRIEILTLSDMQTDRFTDNELGLINYVMAHR